MKNVAIVTGASGGLGKEFVKLILEMPEIDEIWAMARSRDKLAALAAELGDKVKPYPADLSSIDAIKSFGEQMLSEDINVSILVNNAGYAKFGSYGDIDVDETVNMIDLNVNGVVAMALVCLPYMNKGAQMINIASQASFQPLPYLNVYAATKAFVRNYSRALNLELRDRGICVTAVCPGWIETPFFDRGLIGAEKTAKNFANMSQPKDVAKKAMRDAMRGKDISVYSLYVKFCHAVAKLLPQSAMMRFWLLQQRLK